MTAFQTLFRRCYPGSRGEDPEVHGEQPGEAARAEAGARGQREGHEGGRRKEEAGAARGRQEHQVRPWYLFVK